MLSKPLITSLLFSHITLYMKKQLNFTLAISSTNEPKSYNEACTQPEWIKAIEKEIQVLQLNKTWDLAPLPKGKTAIDDKP